MKVKINLVDYYIKDWRFWYKLLLGTSILIVIFVQILTSLVGPNATIKAGQIIKNSDGTFHLSFSFVSLKSGVVNISALQNNSDFKDWFNPKIASEAIAKSSLKSVEMFIRNNPQYFHFDYNGDILYLFGFFTIQSNIFVVIACLHLAIYHPYEGKIKTTNFYVILPVATYITITSLVFNFMLMPTMLTSGKPMSASSWVENEILHTIGPILFVVYVCIFMNKNNFMHGNYFWRHANWIYIMYPIAYGIVTMLCGELKIASNYPLGIQYPYFFLEIHSKEPIPGLPISGAVWFVIAVSLIAAMCLGFSALYNYAGYKMKDKKFNLSWKERVNNAYAIKINQNGLDTKKTN